VDTLQWLAWLSELRRRVIGTLACVLVVFVVCFSYYSHELYAFVSTPLVASLPPRAVLIATSIPEIFLLHLRLSLLASALFTSPVWLYQGLRLTRGVGPMGNTVPFLPVAFLGATLFVIGAFFGHCVLFPIGVRFLTNFGSQNVHVMLSVGDVFSLYIRFVIGIGIAFQIPTIVFVLARLRLVTPRFVAAQWRPVILAAFVLAAVITPTPDLVTQSLLAFPLIALYLISIGLCWVVQFR
jgi:sec-independent protein translocase protein TatC